MKTIAFIVCLVALGCSAAAAANEATSVSAAMLTPERIDERTRPDARVCLKGETCGQAAAATGTAPAIAVAAAPAVRKPESIYGSNCVACHDTGAAGAPRKGDATAWGERKAKGVETLYANAIAGINAMPPRGLCGDCSDAEIKAVVDYILAHSQ
jgi:cytochrome c5